MTSVKSCSPALLPLLLVPLLASLWRCAECYARLDTVQDSGELSSSSSTALSPSSASSAVAAAVVDNNFLFGKRCPSGYDLHFDKRVRKYECRCKKYHLYWPEDGLCYREYQQGPCPDGHR